MTNILFFHSTIAGEVNPCENVEFQIDNHVRDLVNPFSLDNTLADEEQNIPHVDEENNSPLLDDVDDVKQSPLLDDVSQTLIQELEITEKEFVKEWSCPNIPDIPETSSSGGPRQME